MALLPRQELFARYYVKTGIAAVAYRKAGYECTGEAVYSTAHAIRRNPKVKERIEELEAQAIKAADLTKDRLLGWLVDIAKRAKEKGDLSAEGANVQRLAQMTGNLVHQTQDVNQKPDSELLSALQGSLSELLGEKEAKQLKDKLEQQLTGKTETPPLPEATNEAPEQAQ